MARRARQPLKCRPVNDLATRFLQTYADGGEADEGWLYGKALRQARLDHSPESLARLDALMTQIRVRAQPTTAQLASVQGRNFMALVAFYLVEVARRRTAGEIAWHDRTSAARVLPPGVALPDEHSSRLVAIAIDHGAVFRPLAWVESQLDTQGPWTRAAELVDEVVQRLERDGPAEWWRAAYAVGRIASWQMQALAHGRAPLPSLIGQAAAETVVTLGSGLATLDALQEAAAEGVRRLETNPDDAGWQVFSYNGFSEWEGERIGAVIVFAASYRRDPLRMVVAFPYRAPADGQPLVILRPAVRESNVSVDTLRKLNGALERGMRGLQWELGGNWDAFTGT